jgi:C2H2-type zinc finger protein
MQILGRLAVLNDLMLRRRVGNPVFTAMLFGLAGGLAGAVIMGGLAYAISQTTIGGDPFFVVAAKLIGFSGPGAWAFGWLLHVIVGMIIGAASGVAISRLPRLRTISVGGRLLLGVSAGVIAWVILFIPMVVFLMPQLMSLGSVGGGFLVNIVFGLILGAMFVIGQVFFFVEPEIIGCVCDVCSARFPNIEELGKHSRQKHPSLVESPGRRAA